MLEKFMMLFTRVSSVLEFHVNLVYVLPVTDWCWGSDIAERCNLWTLLAFWWFLIPVHYFWILSSFNLSINSYSLYSCLCRVENVLCVLALWFFILVVVSDFHILGESDQKRWIYLVKAVDVLSLKCSKPSPIPRHRKLNRLNLSGKKGGKHA